MKKILIPTDFSPCSKSALILASRFARKMSAEIILLHTIEIPEIAAVFPSSAEWFQSDSADMHMVMHEMQESKTKMGILKTMPELQGIPVYDSIEIGSAETLINTAAEKYQADLILMCTNGESGMNGYFIGSHAEKIIRATTKPLLAICSANVKMPEKIIFSTDLSAEAWKTFPKVRDFAALSDAEVFIVKVNTLDQYETTRETMQNASDFLNHFNISPDRFIIYNDLSVETGIVNFAQDNNFDMVALACHHRNKFFNMFNHSLSEGLLSHLNLPVLNIPCQD